jgi:hypothetical protein
MQRTIAFVVLFLGLSFRLFAQAATQLTLPFFDDFARYNRLDTLKWMPGSSVYINNSYSKIPITKNIATFNGILSSGKISPAIVTNPAIVDVLTSRKINLSGKNPVDSVYLSYYLELGGLGDIPVGSSFFAVEFLNNAGVWQEVDKMPSPVTRTDFKQRFVIITDPVFFHSNFQFRFKHNGRINLARDTWNLDYVFLAAGRSKSATRQDIAVSRPLTSVLKRYAAMPIHQFQANISGEVTDSLFTTFNNLENNIRSYTAEAYITKANSQPVLIKKDSLIAQPALRNFPWVTAPSASIFSGISGEQDIKATIILNNSENLTPETQFNDTITRITPLRNYYAYDDGSIERVFYVDDNVGTIAHKFRANQPDRVSAIQFYLPKYNNQPGKKATFKIWNEDGNGNPVSPPLFSSSFTIPAIADLDNWFTIPVSPSVLVNNNFYIGWTVNGDQFAVGGDKNNVPRGMFRFMDAAVWAAPNEDALMLRAVMNNNITTGLTEAMQALAQVKLFPNPASGQVTIQGEFQKGYLLDATGRQVHEFTGNGTAMQLDVRDLPAGLYVVKLQNKTALQTIKLIIQPN